MYPALSPQQIEDMDARWREAPGGLAVRAAAESTIDDLHRYAYVGDQDRNDAALPCPIPADAPLPEIEWGPERGLRASTKAVLILGPMLALLVIADRLFT